MTVLSKLPSSRDVTNSLIGREWSFPYNCYEVGHGWTPYCTQAAFDIGVSAAKNAFPLYTSLYLFTQLGLQRKYELSAFVETAKSILASTSFLSFNLYAGIAVSCTLRNSTDRYYYRIQTFLPPLIASYLALLIERPSRRPALAFYVANLSSELLYKWAVSVKMLKPVPNGETLLFAAGLATYLHFVRVHGHSRDPVSTALRLLIGSHEAKKSSPKQSITNVTELKQICDASNSNNSSVSVKTNKTHHSNQYKLVALYNDIHNAITQTLNLVFDKHELCTHNGVSCVDYSLTPFISRFTLGYLIRSAMNIPKQLPLARTQPLQAIKNSFALNPSTRNFGLFLASLVCVSRTTHCVLRRATNKQEDWHSFVAGGLGGLSMYLSPKSTLSTYVIWKCLEQYFFLAVKQGKIVRVNECIGAIYAISVNILLYTFALEPRFIRPSYMKFIDRLSDHRLHQINRMVLDVFGTGASIGYEEYFPNLEPRFMTREFKELIFNWLIQPYQ